MLAIRQWVKNLFPVKKSSEPYFILHHTDKVLYDFSSLLNGSQSHNLTHYIYLNDDNSYEDLISKCKGYYLCRSESSLITNQLDGLKDILNDVDHILELGPGSDSSFTNKTLKILRALPDLKKYTAIDLCKMNAQSAANHARQVSPDLSCSYIVDNFNNMTIKRNKKDRLAYLFLGSTIGNLSREEVDNLIGNLCENMNKNDKIIIAMDSNKDPKTLKSAYDNEYARKLFMNALLVINERLCELDLSKISIHYNWNERLSQVEYYFQSSEDQNLLCSGIKMHIKKNKKYCFIKSRKYDRFELENLFRKHNLKLLKSLKDDNNSMMLAIFQKSV